MHAPRKRSVRLRIDYCAALILGYAISRLYSKPISYILVISLIAYLLLKLRPIERAVVQNAPPFIISLVFLALAAQAFPDMTLTIYCMFASSIMFFLCAAGNLHATSSPWILMLVAILTAIACLTLHPAVSTEGEVNIYAFDPRGDRGRYFFVHANEAGLFCAALMGCCAARLPKNIRANAAVPQAAGLAVTSAILIGLSLQTQSFTALFLISAIAFALLFTKRLATIGAIGYISVFAGVLVLQLLYPEAVVQKLETGSLWWRFLVASEVMQQAELVSYDVDRILIYNIWTHSLALDLVATVGIIVGGSLSILLVYWAARKTARMAILYAATGTTMLLQPVGAMPTSFYMIIVMLAAFSSRENAELKSRRRANAPRGPAELIVS